MSEGRPCVRSLAWRGGLGIALVLGGGLAVSWAAGFLGLARRADRASGFEWFREGAVHEVRLVLGPAGVERLRLNPRDDVDARVTVNGEECRSVEVHLKGSTGSFRPVDDTPSFTLDFGPDQGRAAWMGGVRKVHLNNSVEDPSYLCEALGAAVFAGEGLAAPRVGHARVWLNGRALGLYVVREGFTEGFLTRCFGRADGVLLEPEGGSDVGGEMQRRAGVWGVESRVVGPAGFDADRVHRFMALEVLLGHRDGYSLARNNYRLYRDASTGRWQLVPHGMDQLFGTPDLPWKPMMAGDVARAVMACPEGTEGYRKAFDAVFERWLAGGELVAVLDRQGRALQADLTARERRLVGPAMEELRRRILERTEAVRRQRGRPPLEGPEFSRGRSPVTRWAAVDAASAQAMERDWRADGRTSLRVVAGGETGASWRARVRLGRGHYCFSGQARGVKVAPLPFGRSHGVALRVAGRDRPGAGLLGSSGWTPLSVEFEVTEVVEEVELVCELRASRGEAWFDAASLELIREPEI